MKRTVLLASSVIWAILGVFLALFAQYAAANIEQLIGIEMGSENTKDILKIIEYLSVSYCGYKFIIGPILEEIVFRKIIFGSLHKRFNFLYLCFNQLSHLCLGPYGARAYSTLFSNGLYVCLSLCQNKTYHCTDFCPCRNEYHWLSWFSLFIKMILRN